jgi:hypothetical protein
MSEPKEAEKPIKTVAKLTVKVGGDPRKVANMPSGRLWLCDIFGRTLSLKTGVDKRSDNEWVALAGKFEAFYPETGFTYQSGKMFLPSGVQDVVESAVSQMPKDDQMASVDFAFRIYAVKASNPIGYSYEAEALIDMNTNDGLDDIRQLVNQKRTKELASGAMQKLLPPPETETQASPAQAPAPPVPPAPPAPPAPATQQSARRTR